MRWPADTYLGAVGVSLPEPTPVATAVAGGAVAEDRVHDLGYVSVCVDESTAPPDRALRAARSAIERAEVADLGAVLHCSTWFQGLQFWPVASYVADGLRSSAPGYDLQQRCNGGLAALESAAGMLHSGLVERPVLVTTADRFAAPAVDRFHVHDRAFYGDGATAAVLTRTGGVARVLASATVADNSLEPVTRGADAPTDAPPAREDTVDLVARAQAYYAEHDPTRVQARLIRTITRSISRATRDAGTPLSALRRVVTAAQGQFRGEHQFNRLIGVDESKLTWEFGSTTGHIGAGDWFAAVDHLLTTGSVTAGDRVLLVGGGAGFTCTSVVLEF